MHARRVDGLNHVRQEDKGCDGQNIDDKTSDGFWSAERILRENKTLPYCQGAVLRNRPEVQADVGAQGECKRGIARGMGEQENTEKEVKIVNTLSSLCEPGAHKFLCIADRAKVMMLERHRKLTISQGSEIMAHRGARISPIRTLRS
ncbi:hypothetical protein MPH_14004 [Macrophomina phaseolina MS6]|uniref:Uncharacterized protein n=1 Tax=Macrophomina phaseolina (strain MS6) TaxID=1126212 RepID=K2R4C4_MACPH|nr:hypothetical protein MPH_14004 [Macrophomina phaseolina MS6]